jgi:hypothetical protein
MGNIYQIIRKYFTAQFSRSAQSPKLQDITDEEIEEEAVNQFGDSTNIPEIGFKAGARWAIEQIKKLNK